jgi:hypothetical protein
MIVGFTCAVIVWWRHLKTQFKVRSRCLIDCNDTVAVTTGIVLYYQYCRIIRYTVVYFVRSVAGEGADWLHRVRAALPSASGWAALYQYSMFPPPRPTELAVGLGLTRKETEGHLVRFRRRSHDDRSHQDSRVPCAALERVTEKSSV